MVAGGHSDWTPLITVVWMGHEWWIWGGSEKSQSFSFLNMGLNKPLIWSFNNFTNLARIWKKKAVSWLLSSIYFLKMHHISCVIQPYREIHALTPPIDELQIHTALYLHLICVTAMECNVCIFTLSSSNFSNLEVWAMDYRIKINLPNSHSHVLAKFSNYFIEKVGYLTFVCFSSP